MADGFSEFWAVYPRRVGKLAALKAFTKARKMATTDQIIDGVERYLRHKPSYADWAHPSSWLNAGRWMDEYTEQVTGTRWEPFACPHQPECHGRAACDLRTKLDAMKAQAQA
jgi:hypothetical protein